MTKTKIAIYNTMKILHDWECLKHLSQNDILLLQHDLENISKTSINEYIENVNKININVEQTIVLF